jgi:hypothetical protein
VSDKLAHSLLNSLKESSLLDSLAGAAESFFSFSLFLGVFAAFCFVGVSLDGVLGLSFQSTKQDHKVFKALTINAP